MTTKKHPEQQYLDLLRDIMENGSNKELFFTPEILQQYAEKGEKPPFIRSVFGRQIRFDLSEGFPLLTTKKTFLRGILVELIWFLRGDSNIKYLIDNNVHIWDEWAFKKYQWAMDTQKATPLTYEAYMEKAKTDPKFLEKYDLNRIFFLSL